MKVLVTVKRTPHRDARVTVAAGGKGLDTEGLKYEVNPFDELAVEEALRLKDRVGCEVVVVTAGGEASGQQLLSALAMGADRAVRVDAGEDLDSLQVARLLAAVVRREEPALVLCGKLAVDDESAQVPSILAALLGWPQANQASRLELAGDGRRARVWCEVDSGIEVVEVELPAVVTADLRLNEPRYASLPGIMKARKKPLEVIALEALGGAGERRSTVREYRPLPPKPPGKRVGSVDELLAALAERGLV